MIRTVHLSKRYPGGVLALDALNLQVEPGEIYCLLGGSSSGKTTAVRLILGLVEPSAGRVELAVAEGFRPVARGEASLMYLPAHFPFYERLSALENLALFCRLAGCRPSPGELQEALRRADIAERDFHARVESLPPGLRQKLAFALARLRDAKAWILDEPLVGLDPRTADEVAEHLVVAREEGKTILWATQDVFRARQLADRVGILYQGRQVLSYTRDQLVYRDLERLYLDYSRGY